MIKLIKECIAEFDEENPDFSRDMKVEAVLSGLILLFIFGAILLDFDIAAVLGGGGLVMLGNEQVKKWKKVIECAKNKKNNVNNTMQESIMKKTIRLTESDLQRIVKRVINEQSEERNFIRGIQRFLNEKLKLNLTVDGKTGLDSDTENAIKKYQGLIKCYPADGTWGPQTFEKMSAPDRKRLKDLIAEEGGLIDRFINWLGL
jgi:hypothetical protein